MLGKLFKRYQTAFLIIFLGFALISCSAGGTTPNSVVTPTPTPTPTPTSTPTSPELVISSFNTTSIVAGESAFATISVSNLLPNESIVVAITNNNNSVISLSQTSCTLSLEAPSCIESVTGVGAGTASFTVSSTNVLSVTSGIITVTTIPPITLSGIIFGTQDGLIFNNGSLIAGNSPLETIDSSQIFGLVIDSSGNLYAGTMGGVFNGFGAGKVFKYNSTLGYWSMLAGSGAGGSLDGSSVNALTVDSSNNLYAGTNAGNVYKYANGIWNLMATGLNQPIKALTLDSNNNLYVGTNNGSDVGDVFKYTNGTWTPLGSPDGTGIQSIAINTTGDIYAATQGNGSDGQVYKYASGTTWSAISAFNDNNSAVNVVVVNGSNLYAGTATGKIHKYDGNGTSWTLLGTPDATSSSAITSMLLNDSSLYAGTNGDSDNGQIYLYDAGNTSWNNIGTLNNGGISVIAIRNSILYTSTFNSGDSTGMVYKYTTMWNPIGTGALDGTAIYSTNIASDGSYYAGTQNNVFKYLAANKLWIQLGNLNDNNGVIGLTTYESNIYAGTLGGNIYLSNNNGGSWSTIFSNSDYQVSDILTNASGRLYASVNYNDPNDQILKDGRVQVYNSSTNTWTIIAGTAPHQSIDGSPINSITLDNAGNLYAVTAGDGSGGLVWEYPVGGSSWVMVGLGTLDGNPITSVVTDSSMNVYVSTSAIQGNQIQGGNVFKYNGSYWMQMNSYPLDALGVTSLNFDELGNLYAATAGGFVWEYSGSGSLWINTGYGTGVSINSNGTSGY